jgi:hypothetical protein
MIHRPIDHSDLKTAKGEEKAKHFFFPDFLTAQLMRRLPPPTEGIKFQEKRRKSSDSMVKHCVSFKPNELANAQKDTQFCKIVDISIFFESNSF